MSRHDIPTGLWYTAEHEWLCEGEPATVGLTAHAAEELGDLVFVALPAPGTVVASGSPCVEVESTKSVVEVFAPVPGEIVAVNEALAEQPELITRAPYTDGWLFKLNVTAPVGPGLLTADQYAELITGTG